MQDTRTMDILETTEELVQEILVVLVCQAELLCHHWVEKCRSRSFVAL